ncbi:hypothetical protein BDM02DRAFT_3261736 [Thelephora ganbajun]|uniref:Uncharacterized protein n=1 Tax=Thelephora ganbajun TaxID=370292 RepID=A0ACB6ZD85_THEGA|nr:hypothetical protein BDM02DRAFT_3261736 [Thelephora ganbajun]
MADRQVKNGCFRRDRRMLTQDDGTMIIFGTICVSPENTPLPIDESCTHDTRTKAKRENMGMHHREGGGGPVDLKGYREAQDQRGCRLTFDGRTEYADAVPRSQRRSTIPKGDTLSCQLDQNFYHARNHISPVEVERDDISNRLPVNLLDSGLFASIGPHKPRTPVSTSVLNERDYKQLSRRLGNQAIKQY